MRRVLVLMSGLAIAVAAYRANAMVRVIRALDRRGGLATRRGEGGYARAAVVFAGLHRRAAADAAATLDGAATVVDIGAGPGDLLVLLAELAPASERIGVEPSAEMRAIAAQRGIGELDGRAEALPLGDASADLVVSTLSAHHWNDPVAAFREIARVLRPGGEGRIYDVRFAGFSGEEARKIAIAAGLDATSVRRSVLADRLFGLRLYSLLTITTRETTS
jgi:SAM-dependent methyltransferase